MLEAAGETNSGSGTAVDDPPFDGGRTPGEKSNDKAKFSTGTGGALLTVTSQAYESVRDPLEWAKVAGSAIHASGLFGVVNPAQGFVIAFDAFTRRIPLLQYAQTYHIIEGKLSMRADAMLARFLEAGGRIKWKNQGDDGQQAVADFSVDGAKYTIGYTLDDATRAGASFKPGSNWSKRPGEMLRARLISKAIRMLMPQVIAGVYCPEDFESGEDGLAKLKPDAATMVPVANVENVQPIVKRIETTAAPGVPSTAAAAPAADVASVHPATAAAAPTNAFAQQITTLEDLVDKLKMPLDKFQEALRKRGVERAADLTVEQAADLIKRLSDMLQKVTAAQAAPTTAAPAAPATNLPITPGAPGYATGDQMNRLIELRKQLQMPDAAWQAVLSKRGLNATHELKTEDAAEIIGRLEAKLATTNPQALPVDPRTIDAGRKTDELTAWASGATLPNPQGRPQTAAPGPSNG